MEPRIRHTIFWMIILISGLGYESLAQSRYDSVYSDLAKRYPETLVIFTDRTFYAVNEPILFSAILRSGLESQHGPGSTVLYAELVNSFGTAVTKGKYPIAENHSGGYLSIPSTLLSGIYYLRCYTRWMRNFGPGDFAYLPVRVVNPYSTDMAVVIPDQKQKVLMPVSPGSRIVSPSPDRDSYHAGDRVEVEFLLNEGLDTMIQYGCISVIPSGAIDTSVFNYRVDPGTLETHPFQFNYLPETGGTSISGIVVGQNNQEPVSDALIHFSILGEEPSYFVTRSDKAGRIQIYTPARTGEQEMFVVPDYQDGNPVEVHIDNDFTSEPLPFRPGSFELLPGEQILASRLALHMQLQGAYLTDSVNNSPEMIKQPDPVPFYGTPEFSVRIDEFINLPNMEEVIENLVPNTYVIHRGGSAHFLIKSANPMISMFSPLILIDHIPVFDVEVIMSIPPSKIDHIDVIPEVYVLGGVKYGGIISFTSRQADLASIRLPEGSYFFDYTAFHPGLLPRTAKFTGPGKIPDTRNTLFWMEHAEIREHRSLKVDFQAGAVPGTYLVLYRGVSSRGDMVFGLNHFRVE
jgi:hypothetical protein